MAELAFQKGQVDIHAPPHEHGQGHLDLNFLPAAPHGDDGVVQVDVEAAAAVIQGALGQAPDESRQPAEELWAID